MAVYNTLEFMSHHKPTHIFRSLCIRSIMSTTGEPKGSEYKEELIMLNENVVKLLKSGMWDLATCDGGEPNVQACCVQRM